jgi:hypothetical protein
MDTSITVTAELGIRLVVPQQAVVPLLASLHYSSADPYAIRVAFHVGLDEPVEWIFARELLNRGLEGHTGLGDVRVWPSASAGILEIELSSPFGHAHFEVPSGEVAGFLDRTYRLVPAGAEGDHVDVEAELANLLRQA